MYKVLVLTLLACLVAVSAQATSLDIGFNDNSAQVGLSTPIHQDYLGSSQVNGRFLYNNDKDTRLGSAGFDFIGEPGNVPGLGAGVGARVYGGKGNDTEDILTLGVGGRVSYAPPNLNGLGVSGRLIYSPRIFSFLDVHRMLEAGARVFYAITPKVRINLDYQNIQADYKHRDDVSVDEGLRIGFEAHF